MCVHMQAHKEQHLKQWVASVAPVERNTKQANKKEQVPELTLSKQCGPDSMTSDSQ